MLFNTDSLQLLLAVVVNFEIGLAESSHLRLDQTETRTKESNIYASIWVFQTPYAQ